MNPFHVWNIFRTAQSKTLLEKVWRSAPANGEIGGYINIINSPGGAHLDIQQVNHNTNDFSIHIPCSSAITFHTHPYYEPRDYIPSNPMSIDDWQTFLECILDLKQKGEHISSNIGCLICKHGFYLFGLLNPVTLTCSVMNDIIKEYAVIWTRMKDRTISEKEFLDQFHSSASALGKNCFMFFEFF
jgi:hypothetical protein